MQVCRGEEVNGLGKLVIGPGTVVLNQDPRIPMSGVVQDTPAYRMVTVLWSNGVRSTEDLRDITLTADINLVVVTDYKE